MGEEKPEKKRKSASGAWKNANFRRGRKTTGCLAGGKNRKRLSHGQVKVEEGKERRENNIKPSRGARRAVQKRTHVDQASIQKSQLVLFPREKTGGKT